MKKILVVDDSITIRNLIKFALNKDGFSVTVARDGLEALEKIKEKPYPDCVVLDIEMPKMNGYEVCRILKQNPDYKDIPVIMLTAKDESSDREWGLDLGADEYLTKPFEYEVLKQKLDKLLD